MNETVAISPENAAELRNPELVHQINKLRRLDNVTNWPYLAREYFYCALVLVPTLWFYHRWESWGISWFWNIPVTLLAIFFVGLVQHRLVMLGHEASHYALFKNWKLNEIASNWLCFYPLWSMAYNYRLQHMAHHQYTNDPERDPDLIYMEISGQRFNYPMPIGRFLWDCVITLFFWIPGLVKNVVIRARFANQGGTIPPYMPQEKPSKVVFVIDLLYVVSLIATLTLFTLTQNTLLLAIVPVGWLAVLLVVTRLIPERLYVRTGVKPVIAPRRAIYQRCVYFTLLFTTMAWLSYSTGRPWLAYYLLLWIVPLFTTWSFFMLLREEIQHSNTGQGKFVDTRDFRGNPLVKWSLFPYNMDYHLGHHLFGMIPHYNLPKLDKLLSTTEVYRQNQLVVWGYLFSRKATHE